MSATIHVTREGEHVALLTIDNPPRNTLGTAMHIVCKPSGAQWVERKIDASFGDNEWVPVEGSGVGYAATTAAGGQWRGEVAIPWSAIGDASRGRPALLRFNFAQHKTANGESTSWCGPVDFGRDDAFTGTLVIRNTSEPAFLDNRLQNQSPDHRRFNEDF